jgi:Domain of unknown function (DUF4489)
MKLNYNGPEKYEDKRYEEKKYDCYKCEDKKYDEKHYEDRKYEQKCDYHQPCCEEHKYAKCEHKSPCAYGILFECNNGMGTTIPASIIANAATPNVERSLGCVTIDTRCLKMPTVKFDFSSTISFVNIASTVGTPVFLTFGLFKVCENNGEEIPCGVWDYVIDLAIPGETLTTTFSFTHCECSSCPDCCTYYVKIISAVNPAGSIVRVNNPSLSVMAKSSC